jgi:hypothetical protein
MNDPENVYIGRGGVVMIANAETGKKERFPKRDSIWANPYKISESDTREVVIEKYEKMIR